jgi:formate-dependent phosphoribosylglycinamide formyltransferase (GAR transformylase)
MNLPTRCCYVKVQGKEAVKITSLRVGQPKVDQKELAAVLSEYKRRYQRDKQEAAAVLQRVAAGLPFSLDPAGNSSGNGSEVNNEVSALNDRFNNPFAAGAVKEKEKPVE